MNKQINWQQVAIDMHEQGYATIPKILSNQQCVQLVIAYDKTERYRKIVNMARYRFGLGEYKYYDYPLPNLIQTLRQEIYPNLVPIANLWMSQLKIDLQFPLTHNELVANCHNQGQIKPTPLILKYGKGGYNTLHQDLYGAVYFPMQAAIFLNQVGDDYTGGEFVLTQQVPRAQSKAIVLTPNLGDMIIFTTNFRPVESVKGHYRANMRHGVSEVHSGVRHTLGIIFHDALS